MGSPAPTSQADGQLVWGGRTMRSSHTILESAIFFLTISSVLVGAVSADGGHLSLRGGGHGQGWERRSASFSDHESKGDIEVHQGQSHPLAEFHHSTMLQAATSRVGK